MKIHLVGNRESGEVRVNGARLDPGPSLKLRNHSPTGFSWGYEGSGPAQLALALLLRLSRNNHGFALANYQRFKSGIIATLPQTDINLEIELSPWIPETLEEWRKNSKGPKQPPLFGGGL